MVAALRNQSLGAHALVRDTNRVKLTPFVQGVGRQGLVFRGVTRRERLCFGPPAVKSRGDKEEPFSLRDSETLGNLGVVGVLATAVIVGGALVIFNPYAGQNIKQETIKVAKVPEPLPSKPESKKSPFKPAAAPEVAAKPTPTPAPIIASTPAPAFKKPAPPPKPAPAVKKPSRAPPAKGGFDTGSLVGGLAVVAAVGGGVAYFASSFSENGAEQAPAAASADANTPPTEAEKSSSEETPQANEANVEDARTWISEWRDSQK